MSTDRPMNITLREPDSGRPAVHDMVIVHRIFRRGFREVAALVARTADGATGRAEPIADHAAFLLDALHHHHAAEDEYLWPLLLSRVQPRAELVHRMEAQHQALAGHVEQTRALLGRWRATADRGTADELSTAVTRLAATLTEHLDDEEREILPLVEEHVTAGEWAELGQRSFDKFPRSVLPIMHGTMLEVTTPQEAAEFTANLPTIVKVMWRLVGRRRYARYIRRVRSQWPPFLRGLGARANRLATRLYRRGVGRTAKAKLPVMLVTVRGRRSGQPRTVPISYFPHDGGLLAAASAGGSKPEPEWFHNVRVADAVHLRVGDEEFDAHPRVLDRAERDRLWQEVVLARAPFFADYETKAGRVIPLVLFTPA
ncbi:MULTISPECIES: nitroreductase family deazaflavin-dependent oxidoreductase [unclassified Saccharothrix]|uniref:nitroreductase family deazaflavin-dependent oxidoreductase n=1 Tax=unclassified Saccharothrix TaxID=2593673 RepID=UPI00307D8DD3